MSDLTRSRHVRHWRGPVGYNVARYEFDKSPLDIHGRQPFTLIAWTKFVGERHLVAGIWDEGGWDKYDGRRQIALFGGLFGSKGVIGHVSDGRGVRRFGHATRRNRGESERDRREAGGG